MSQIFLWQLSGLLQGLLLDTYPKICFQLLKIPFLLLFLDPKEKYLHELQNGVNYHVKILRTHYHHDHRKLQSKNILANSHVNDVLVWLY